MYSREHIERVVREVFERMEVQITPEREKLLILITGGNKSVEQIDLELKRLSEVYTIGVALSEMGREIVPQEVYNSYEILKDRSRAVEFLAGAKGIVLPLLTKNTCSKLVAGILDTLPAYIAAKALMEEKEVVACYDSCRGSGKGSYNRIIEKNIEELKAHGVFFLESRELGEYLLKKKSSTVRYLNRKIIMGEDIRGMKDVEILVDRGTVITPLAYDRAREERIRIRVL